VVVREGILKRKAAIESGAVNVLCATSMRCLSRVHPKWKTLSNRSMLAEVDNLGMSNFNLSLVKDLGPPR